jgi:ribosomal protein S18 acetylase RimI-like enzyme
MNLNMEVRIATIDDANDLFTLNELFENTTTIDLLKKSLLENEDEVVCIALSNGIPAGFCSGMIIKSMCYSNNRADIEALFVKDEYRRQGIGKALIECLEKSLIARGAQHFHINTYANNIAAQSLYVKLGYAKTGEILMDKDRVP